MKLPSETGRTTTDPIPTKFFEKEAVFLTQARAETGLSTSEIIRRSVRLMRRKQEIDRSYGFVIELTT